ncbi:MAG: diguanylate cyclase [Clostridiales bacterium]|nr:diguanylate cyclase [Clostridiales bacterium]
MNNKICMVVCGNFFKEIKAIIESEGYKNVRLNVFPSECVTFKKVEYENLVDIISKTKEECTSYEVFCSSGCVNIKSIDESLKTTDDRVYINKTDVCFHMLVNKSILEYYIKERNYILTPGWLLKWKHYVKEVWKFNEETAQEFFKDTTSQLLLLDTGVYENTYEHLKEFSEYVNRPYHVIPVGLDYLRGYINNIIMKNTYETKIENQNKQLQLNNQKLVDYALIFDVFSNLTEASNESVVIESIINMTRMFFGAEKVKYISIHNNEIMKVVTYPKNLEFDEAKTQKLFGFKDVHMLTDSGSGFVVNIGANGERLGVVCIDNVSKKEFILNYLNTFLDIRNVCGLAIRNSRIYSDFIDSQKNLSFQTTYFKQLFKNSPESIMILNKDLSIKDINDEFTKLFQYSLDELSEKNSIYSIIPTKDIDDFNDAMAMVLEGGYIKHETSRVKKDGIYVSVEMLSYPIVTENELIGIYIIYSDITTRIEQQKIINKLAFTDELTGLSTRRVFNDRLQMQLEISKRNKDVFAVVYIDLDKFKEINDTYGHDVGDKVLIEVANKLSEGVRKSDTVARIGGDEFVLILSNLKSKDDVEIIMDKMNEKMKLEFIDKDINIPIRASIGFSVYPYDGLDSETLIKKSDESMYQVKYGKK